MPVCGSSPRVRGKRAGKVLDLSNYRIIPASAGQTCSSLMPAATAADHPRECGANSSLIAFADSVAGSSPRVRGKLRRFCRIVDGGRIIPASAGQTSRRWCRRPVSQDHPRECGANSQEQTKNTMKLGSSPRVRGKRHVPPSCRCKRRIIPASAGQTQACFRLVRCFADHPRECGANGIYLTDSEKADGSSPRVRGKRRVKARELHRVRIIPASAGQTMLFVVVVAMITDHPRECGANSDGPANRCSMLGSSPRVRGKQARRTGIRRQRRIIPASAGQTRCGRCSARRLSDHPRECGANVFGVMKPAGYCGSSPRVRGKHLFDLFRHCARRIIPASAGQTAQAKYSTCRTTDHPRECGANSGYNGPLDLNYGSSPRVRGKQRASQDVRHQPRIIPASAGQTSPILSHCRRWTDHPRECGANQRCYGHLYVG